MKSSLINTTVYLNDQVIDNVTNLDPYTVYVNPFYVVTGLLGGDRVSKHYYMNQQRVATDITINYDPNGGAGGGEYAPSKGLDDLKKIVQELSHEPLDTSILALPSLTDYYPETSTAKSSNSQAEGAGSSGRILFWYHPDYLGNVDLVTEIDGFAHEFFIYNPWGEEMHQWNANTYAFTSHYRRALRHLFAQPRRRPGRRHGLRRALAPSALATDFGVAVGGPLTGRPGHYLQLTPWFEIRGNPAAYSKF
jgi:hypothetical protein